MVEVLNHGHLERRRRRKVLLVLAAPPHPFRKVLLIGVQSRRFHACLLEVASCRACVHPRPTEVPNVDELGRMVLGAFWPCASHEPIHHFAVTSRAARIDASSQILAPDGSPPKLPVLGRTTAKLHRRDTILKAPIDIGTEPHLRGKWRQVVVKFSATQGLCIVLYSHANTTRMLSHNISTTRPLVMHLRAARLALNCMARAGSLYVYRPL